MSPAGQTLLSQGATRTRKAKSIANEKTLAAVLANVAELGAERMVQTIGKAGPRYAAIGTVVPVDKMLIRICASSICRASACSIWTRSFLSPETATAVPHILFRAEEVDQ